jgi:drug/metabolite transporter (DMT)-like permease
VLLIGIASALVASAMFNVGIVLQAIDARAAPAALGLRLSLLWRLLHQRRWVLGFVLGVVGLGPQVLAYGEAPFVVVQPVLAIGLVIVLAVGERLLGERVGLSEGFGVAAIIGGVALVSWGAPSHTEAHRGAAAVVSVVGGLSLVALAPFALRATRLDRAMLTIVASGCGFGVANIATKLLGDDFPGHLTNAFIWAVVGVVMGIAATVTGMTAFQRAAATIVVPVSTAVQTFLPIILEPLFLRERWDSARFDGIPLAAGLALALVGCVLLARSRAVSTLLASAAGGS